MIVDLIGSTWLHRATVEKYMKLDDGIHNDAERLIEFAGRACYQSFHRPHSLTANIRDYLRNILTQGHGSVLEHSQATFYITGISRSCTHEIIRHRHLSYSELSQRFVDVETANMVTPPALRPEWVEDSDEIVEGLWWMRRAYKRIFDHLTAQGAPRKQAREAARAMMPNMTETRIVITGNFRAWRDVLKVRGTVHADAEIRQLVLEIAEQLKMLAPNVFQDMNIVYVDGVRVIVFEDWSRA